MNRMHETVTKLQTDFGKLYLHISWHDATAKGFSISHQQKDFDSEMVKAIDALSGCFNRAAILRNPSLLRQIVDGLQDAITAGP